MDDDGVVSTLTTLIARIESYANDPTSFNIPGSSTRHESWLADETQRIDAATQLAEELMALQSIYTDEAIHLLKLASINGASASTSHSTKQDEELNGQENVADPNDWMPGSRITLSISTDIEAQGGSGENAIPIRLAATLPPFYPHSQRPPQLQLLSRYIGGFSVDAKLFGEILKAFYHQSKSGHDTNVDAEEHAASSAWIGGSMDRGVHWASGEVVLFEGIEWVKEKVTDWWNDKEAERLATASASSSSHTSPAKVTTFIDSSSAPPPSPPQKGNAPIPEPFTGTLFQTESIIERKSEFIGYAASITSPDQVPSILSRILSDKRVARATHPIINAWVCKSASDGVVHRDCDDDGETAAGGRLAHLLSILELENVIVVVTRWYGGVHLGPDRFKLINRAAREALDLGGFVGKNGDDASKGKGMGKRNS